MESAPVQSKRESSDPHDGRSHRPSESANNQALYACHRTPKKGDAVEALASYYDQDGKVGQKRGRGGFATTPNIRIILAPEVGLEPTTLRLTAGCSAIELLRNDV